MDSSTHIPLGTCSYQALSSPTIPSIRRDSQVSHGQLDFIDRNLGPRHRCRHCIRVLLSTGSKLSEPKHQGWEVHQQFSCRRFKRHIQCPHRSCRDSTATICAEGPTDLKAGSTDIAGCVRYWRIVCDPHSHTT